MTEKKIPEVRFKGFEDDWEQRKLGEVYKERKEKGNDNLPILSVSIHTGVSDSELNSNSLGKEVKRSEDKTLYKHTYPGDLVFNMMRAWQGAIGVVKNEGMVSPAYIVANPNDKLYPRFMNYYFQRETVISQINNLSYGVTDFRKRLYWDSFILANTAFPSINEQKNISNFFEKLSDTITLHQRKLDLLRQLKQAYLQMLFPKNQGKIPELRFANFNGEWEQYRFGDVWEKSSERNTQLDYQPKDVISVAKMRLTTIDRESTDEYMKTYNVLHRGDIAFEGNKSKDFSFGRFVLNDIQDGIVSHVFNVYRPKIDMSISFMKIFINNENIMKHILVKATTKTLMMTTLNSKDIVKQKLILPSNTEQQHIGKFFKQLDKIINYHQNKIKYLNKLKQSFLRKMFI